MSWSQLIQNPKSLALKKFMIEILGQKVNPYDDLITRLRANLVTDNDFKLFGEMMNDILQTGYFKAVEDYREELGKLGYKVNLLVKD